MATLGDSDMVSDNVLRRSFEGIAVTRPLQQKAREIIMRTFVADKLVFRGSPNREARLVAIYDRKDSLLLALLATASDTSRYLENSVRLRPSRTPRP